MASFCPPIGIDLGTTFCCIGVYKDHKVHIIQNETGSSITPSYVAFTEKDTLVGEKARDYAAEDPENTLHNIKRLLGRKINDEDIEEEIEHMLFKVMDDGEGNPVLRVQDKGKTRSLTPEEVSGIIVRELRRQAEVFLKMDVTSAVITVPVHFNDAQREATRAAGKIAGLEVLGVINEPTAAALAYGLHNKDKNSTALIFDFGGGTFDVSILEIANGNFTVLSSGGHSHLGGENITNLLVDKYVRDFKKLHGINIASEFQRLKHITVQQLKKDEQVIVKINAARRALRRLYEACEKLKITLSTHESAKLEIPLLFEEIDFSMEMSREWFDTHCIAYAWPGAEDVLKQALLQAKLSKDDITDIVLVGGSTRIPVVQSKLQAFFNGRELCKELNPDEAVAFGAAVQAALLTGLNILDNVQLTEVTHRYLGLETADGKIAIIVRRNEPLPVHKSKLFSTTADNQGSLTFKVVEGEDESEAVYSLLGEFTVQGIPPAPKGVPKLLVSFDMDTDGIFKVSAQDIVTGIKNGIKVNYRQSRLDFDKIARASEEAEKSIPLESEHQKRSMAKSELEEFVAQVEAVVKTTEFMIKADIEDLGKISFKVIHAHRIIAMEDSSSTELRRMHEELEHLWTQIVRKVYPEKA